LKREEVIDYDDPELQKFLLGYCGIDIGRGRLTKSNVSKRMIHTVDLDMWAQLKEKDLDLISLAKSYHGLENRSGLDRPKEKKVHPIPSRPVPIKNEKKNIGRKKA